MVSTKNAQGATAPSGHFQGIRRAIILTILSTWVIRVPPKGGRVLKVLSNKIVWLP